jgi:hypothetical protein
MTQSTYETGTVTIRKSAHETGYLLSVTRGNTTRPGPKCSNLKTAREVATWIATHYLREIEAWEAVQ